MKLRKKRVEKHSRKDECNIYLHMYMKEKKAKKKIYIYGRLFYFFIHINERHFLNVKKKRVNINKIIQF